MIEASGQKAHTAHRAKGDEGNNESIFDEVLALFLFE